MLLWLFFFKAKKVKTRKTYLDLYKTYVIISFSGILSWVPTYPADCIKTRLQADHFGSKAVYKGTRHCIKCTLEGNSIAILYRGMGSCIYRAFVVNAVVLFVYNYISRHEMMVRYFDFP